VGRCFQTGCARLSSMLDLPARWRSCWVVAAEGLLPGNVGEGFTGEQGTNGPDCWRAIVLLPLYFAASPANIFQILTLFIPRCSSSGRR